MFSASKRSGAIARLFFSFLITAASSAFAASVDPFDPTSDAVDPAGKYQGQPLDISEKRSVSRLTAAEQNLFFGDAIPQGILVKNIFHQGSFYVGVLPVEGPKAVIGVLEHFAPEAVAGHTLWRFQFETPVLLYRSEIGEGIRHQTPDSQIMDLVFSAEYHAPKGVPYGLVAGLKNKSFNLVHRMISLDTKAEYMITKQHHTVDQWRLELLPYQRLAMLIAALARSEKAGYKMSYNTFLDSCTTEFLKVMDDALRIKRLFPLFLGRIPIFAGPALRWRGFRASLKGDGIPVTKLPTLNVERSGKACGGLFSN